MGDTNAERAMRGELVKITLSRLREMREQAVAAARLHERGHSWMNWHWVAVLNDAIARAESPAEHRHADETERLRVEVAGMVEAQAIRATTIRRLRAVLEWYAEPKQYHSGRMSPGGHAYQHEILWDRGERARAALAGAAEPPVPEGFVPVEQALAERKARREAPADERPRWYDLIAELRRYVDSGSLVKESDLYLLLRECEAEAWRLPVQPAAMPMKISREKLRERLVEDGGDCEAGRWPLTVPTPCDHPGQSIADNGDGTYNTHCPTCGAKQEQVLPRLAVQPAAPAPASRITPPTPVSAEEMNRPFGPADGSGVWGGKLRDTTPAPQCEHDLQKRGHTITMTHDLRPGVEYASTARCDKHGVEWLGTGGACPDCIADTASTDMHK